MLELKNNGMYKDTSLLGYTKKEIENMVTAPHRYGNKILDLSKSMYASSGYYKKFINYLINLPKAECWTVDMEVISSKYRNISPNTIKKNYISYVNLCNSFKMEHELSKILLNVYLYDACYGYIVEDGNDRFIYYFDPKYCEITGTVNGILQYSIKKSILTRSNLNEFPPEVVYLISQSKQDEYGRVQIPYNKSFCVKYHDVFAHVMPPFFMMIKEILNIEDYKLLDKTKVENQVYKLLALEIPKNPDGALALSNGTIEPFIELAGEVISKNVGVLPSPMKPIPIEFDNGTKNNISNVKNAIDETYSEIGVSQSLMSGATSGSELKISIEIDASDMYRLLSSIAKVINFHCKIRGFTYPDYGFSFRFLDVTTINKADMMSDAVKLAEISFPNKFEVMGTFGVNPSKVLGNDYLENDIFNLGESWSVLKTAHTTSSDDTGGRPNLKEEELSNSGTQTRENESNDAANRV